MLTTGATQLFAITSPAFILMGLGYLAVKASWLSKQGVQVLAWFVIRIGLPAAIFKALSTKSFHDIFHIDYLVVYGLGSLTAFLTLLSVGMIFCRKTLADSAFFGLGSSMSNSLLIGYPIILQLFGVAALVPFALTLIVENLLILPLSLALADMGSQKGMRFFTALGNSSVMLLKNPIIIAIIVSTLCVMLSVQLPLVATRAIDSLAMTVGGLAQFTIGGIIANIAIESMTKNSRRDVSLVLVGKLIIHPIAVLLMLSFFPSIDPIFKAVAIVLACMPMFSIYSVLALDYDLGEFCSTTLLLTTLMSFVTINLAIWLLMKHDSFKQLILIAP